MGRHGRVYSKDKNTAVAAAMGGGAPGPAWPVRAIDCI